MRGGDPQAVQGSQVRSVAARRGAALAALLVLALGEGTIAQDDAQGDALAECGRCGENMSAADGALCGSVRCVKFRAWAQEQEQEGD